MTEFGLPKRTLDEMRSIFAAHSKVKKVIIYGSRAMGNYRPGSDIDLTVCGEHLTHRDLTQIAGALDDSSIPYSTDLSLFEHLDQAELKHHIQRKGQVFYYRYAEWKTVKLGDVVTYEKVNAQGSSLPYLGMENISSDTMQIVGELEIPVSTSSTFKFDETHVLYGRLRPYLKKVLVPNFEGQCSTEVFCLKPSSSLNRKFLAYWLLSPKIADKIENTSTGARMPRANMNAILEFDFFLPPLAEQQRIVTKLDAAFAEIETAHKAIRKNQANYQALKSAILAQELQSEAA